MVDRQPTAPKNSKGESDIVTGINISAYAVGVIMLVNAAVHYRVDDEKANKLSINLVEDQLLHSAQIIVTIVVASINCWR